MGQDHLPRQIFRSKVIQLKRFCPDTRTQADRLLDLVHSSGRQIRRVLFYDKRSNDGRNLKESLTVKLGRSLHEQSVRRARCVRNATGIYAGRLRMS